MIPIDIQVSRSKVKVKGQAYYTYVGEGGISVLQTSIFSFRKVKGVLNSWLTSREGEGSYVSEKKGSLLGAAQNFPFFLPPIF